MVPVWPISQSISELWLSCNSNKKESPYRWLCLAHGQQGH